MQTATFAQQLRSLRMQAGLSIYALAELSKVDKSFIGQIEAGKKLPSWTTLVKLTDALGVTVEFKKKAGKQ